MRVAALSTAILIGAGGGALPAQTLSHYSVSRQFHGEVHLVAGIEFAGGTLHVAAGAPGTLYSMEVAYDADRFAPLSTWDAGRGAVTLGLASRKNGTIGVKSGGAPQEATIAFSPQADLALSFSLGAAQSVVEFGGLRLASLTLETGASQTELRFSQPNAMRCSLAAFRAGAAELTVRGLGNSRCDRVTFEGGVGSVLLDYTGSWQGDTELDAKLAVGGLTLRIPRAVGVTLTTDQFLASFQPRGFTRQGNRYVSTSNAAARRHLNVTLATSLGGVDRRVGGLTPSAQPRPHPPTHAETDPPGRGPIPHRDFHLASRAEIGHQLPGLHVAEGAAEGPDFRVLDLQHGVRRDFARGEVGDEVAESIHRDHLADDRLAFVERGGKVEMDGYRRQRCAERGGQRTRRERRGRGRKEVATVERGRGAVGRGHGHHGSVEAVEHGGEDAVVRTGEPVTAGAEGQGRPPGADTGIDDHQVDGAGGKPVPGPSQQVGGRAHVAGPDPVAQVGQGDARGAAVEHAPHFRDVRIGGAEVGQQGDE